jgi:Zn-dependent protease
MEFLFYIFEVVILVFSAVVHEVAHGLMANRLGDPTARLEGRLTLNPIKHLDWFGSILLPLIMILSGTGIVFGWAKPVPFNPYNLKDPIKGGAMIALAGPLSNLSLAVVFAILLKLGMLFPVFFSSFPILPGLLQIVIMINLTLGIFNLVPIPPLDGSKIILPLLSPNLRERWLTFERFGMVFVVVFILFGFQIIAPVIVWLFQLLTGV